MKILRLSFSNLNSLRGSFSIDFENGPLAEAGLFAITGSTGVGKTTILDAITLGLFGKAARYDNNKASTPENMMSRGTGACFSEVVFSCKSGMYSVRWDLARARKKPDGRVQSAKRQIATLDGDILETKIREVDQRVVALTGLDYNRFLRSVLLAQGRFKEFLDADRNERGELLEKITGTKIYSELSIAAYGRARDQQAGIDKAKESLEGIRLLDSETIDAHKSEQIKLKEKSDEGEKSLKHLNEKIALYDQSIELKREKESLFQRLEKWTKQSEDFGPEAKRIETFDRASPLQTDLTKWKDLGAKSKDSVIQKENAETQLRKSKEQLRVSLSKAITICERDDKTLKEKCGQQRDAIAKKEESLGQIKTWLEKNKKDSAIEVELPALRSQGENCRALARKNDTQNESINAIKARIQKTDDLKTELKEKSLKANEVLTTKSNAAKRDIAALAEGLAGKTKEAIQHNYDNSKERLAKISELRRLQESFLSESASLKGKRGFEEKESETIKKLQPDLEALEKTILEQRDCLKDKETIHLQATAIASLEERRAQLKEGEACDLCGSLEHPYVSGQLPSESETKKERDLQIQKVDTLVAKEKELSKKLETAIATKAGIAKACEELESKIADEVKKFSELASKMNAGLTIQDEAGLTAFEIKEHDESERLKLLVKAIEAKETKRRESEKEEATARSEVNSLGEQLKQLEQTAKDAANDLDKKETELTKTVKKLAEALQLFCDSTSTWLPKCDTPDATKTAVESLEFRSKTYTDKRNQESDTKTRIDNIKSEAKRIEGDRQRLIREKEEWESKLLAAQMERFESELETWDETRRRHNCDAAAEAMTRSKSEFELKKAEIEKLTSELKNSETELIGKAQEFGFESLENLDTVLSSRAAIGELRLRLRTIEDEKIEIQTLSKKNDASLLSLKEKQVPDEAEAAQLKLEREAEEKLQKEFSVRRVELRIALETDAKARIEQKEQIERIGELEKAARPWLVMRDLIGSADGNAFSRFAQGLTLAQLVIYANKHLRDLNPRYRIHRVADADLELEIIDCYEANAIRPTRSLSGGESFLVSLALALGLSELAGRNTKIESLFIDEGFGSLDTDTLDVALSALENLRFQNRTIGVISHVEELKTRLGTQIQVIRKANGHAELNIVE